MRRKTVDERKSAGNGIVPHQHTVALVANGSSGGWDIAIDEAVAGSPKWFAQVEGPRFSLYFPIRSLATAIEAIEFLERGPRTVEAPNEPLRLGSFGRSPVILTWDRDDPSRCCFVVGSGARPTVRLSLLADERRDLAEALKQVRTDLESEKIL
jgi:hypothetical protein